MDEPFGVRVDAGEGCTVLGLSGDLDARAREPLAAAWSAAEQGGGTVVLDFSGLRYMNSTGIALVVEILARARAARRDLHARGLSPHYRQIFEITRLSDFITLDDPAAGAAA